MRHGHRGPARCWPEPADGGCSERHLHARRHRDEEKQKSKLRKLEKKRRAERQRRRQKAEPLAYRGNKYKTDELVPVVFQTEVGIYESFVMSDRQITDHDVRAALEWLIRGIRGGTIAVLPPQPQPSDAPRGSRTESLITWNIRRHWDEYFEEEPFPGRDNLIGVLRTILGSIEVWGNMSPTSRGYLRYLEGFMGQVGGPLPGDPAGFRGGPGRRHGRPRRVRRRSRGCRQ